MGWLGVCVGKHAETVAMFSPPPDASAEQSVSSRPQYDELSHGGAPRVVASVWLGHHFLGFERPYFEPERCSGFGLTLARHAASKMYDGQQYAPVNSTVVSRVGVLANGCPKVHKLGRLFVCTPGRLPR